jgi:hypothetical protein
MSVKNWEKKVLAAPGRPCTGGGHRGRAALTAGLVRLPGVSQPRVAAIERSSNVTPDVLAQYAKAVGGHLELGFPGHSCAEAG